MAEKGAGAAPTPRQVVQSRPPPVDPASVVAVLERDGQEVDRVALRPEAFADWESIEALVERLNRLPSEERPPVPFYPWGEEETDRILEVVNRHLWTDLEDLRGHYLGALIAVAWKED